jgi:uncharacterized protein (DUF342 family)
MDKMLCNVDDYLCGRSTTEDIVLPNGVKLIQQSTVLNLKHIQVLQRHGIEKIMVTSPELMPGPQPENPVASPHSEQEPVPISQPLPEKKPAHIPTRPLIVVRVDGSKMNAFMRIEPTGDYSENITLDDLKSALDKQEVIFGIDEALLDLLIAKWCHTKILYDVRIAKGIEPHPAKQGDLTFLVKYIKNPKDRERILNTTYCWEVALDPSIPIQRVDPGTIIARQELQCKAISGYTVLGDEITSDEVIRKNIRIDNHIEPVEDNGYKSLASGLVCYIDDALSILPINFDSYVEYIPASDKMTAEIMVHPAYEGGSIPQESEILKNLKERSILFGIDTAAISLLCNRIQNNIYPQKPVIVAKGQSPVHGIDGRIEYTFDANPLFKPHENEHGLVDFKNISLIQSVKKGDVVARRLPPTAGIAGSDIFATPLAARQGLPTEFPAGINTGVSEKDKNVLIALTDGNVRLHQTVIEVSEGYNIKGDVDLSTGNIQYIKSVVIGQDVKAGFTINCGGDCEIGGTIEDAQITAGGNVLCRHGFIGQGKGIIECAGDLSIGFVKNQTIRCHGNVTIAHEAMNAHIYSQKAIIIGGKSLSIAGGITIAHDSITCRAVGTLSNTHTVLEVGLDYVQLEAIHEIDKTIKGIEENKTKCADSMKRIERAHTEHKSIPPATETLYAKLKKAVADFGKEMAQQEEKKQSLRKTMYDYKNAFIKVESVMYPGTLIKIGERHLQVHETINGPKTIRIVKYEITIM